MNIRKYLMNLVKKIKEITIAGILSIQYGNTCEVLYAGMDERFKKNLCHNIRSMLKTLNGHLKRMFME